jgi:hypothetical protein
MTLEFAIGLGLLTLTSVFVSYSLGRWEERIRWQNMKRRERERMIRREEWE